MVKLFPEKPSLPQIKKLIDFASDYYGKKPQRIISAGKDNDFSPEGYEVERKDLDPAIGSGLKRKTRGEDKNDLNLKILKTKEVLDSGKVKINDSQKETTQPRKSPLETEPFSDNPDRVIDFSGKKNKKSFFVKTLKGKQKFLLIPLVIILVALSVNRFLLAGKTWSPVKKEEKIAVPVKPSPTPTLIPEPSFQKSDFSIRILNGVGISGAAGKLKKILRKEGFVVSQIGNAPQYDYKKTEIQAKKRVPGQFIEELKKTLESDYSPIEGKKLDDNQATDVVVIVGKK